MEDNIKTLIKNRTVNIEPEKIIALISNVGKVNIVLAEFIKNAIDSGAKNVCISLDTDAGTIKIEDDGEGFSKNDWEMLTKVGESTKKIGNNDISAQGKMYAGSKGVGIFSGLNIGGTIEIITKSLEVSESVIINKLGQLNFYSNSKDTVGTVVYIKDVSQEYLEQIMLKEELERLKNIILYEKDEEYVVSIDIANKSINLGVQYDKLLTENASLYASFQYKKELGLKLLVKDSFNEYYNGIIRFEDIPRIKEILELEYIHKKFYAKENIYVRGFDSDLLQELPKNMPNFRGEVFVFDGNKTKLIKGYSSGIKVYVNGFGVYNYLDAENDWLRLARLSQSKKNTDLKPHNVYGYVHFEDFNENVEKLKLSNERTHFLEIDNEFRHWMENMRAVIIEIMFNINLNNRKYGVPQKKEAVQEKNSDEQGQTISDLPPMISTINNNQSNTEIKKPNPNVVDGVAILEISEDSLEISTYGDQVNLVSYIVRVKDSNGKNVSNDKVIIKVDNHICNSISTQTEQCEKNVTYTYKDSITGIISKKMRVTFFEKRIPMRSNKIPQQLFVLNKQVNITYNPIISTLISELNSLSISNYNSVISCSLRAIMEISIFELLNSNKFTQLLKKPWDSLKDGGKKIGILNGGSIGIEERVKLVVFYYKNNQKNMGKLADICGFSNDFRSFNNSITVDNYTETLKRCHSTAHKSSTHLSEVDIRDIGKKLGIFMVMVNEMIKDNELIDWPGNSSIT